MFPSNFLSGLTPSFDSPSINGLRLITLNNGTAAARADVIAVNGGAT